MMKVEEEEEEEGEKEEGEKEEEEEVEEEGEEEVSVRMTLTSLLNPKIAPKPQSVLGLIEGWEGD